MFNEKSSEYCSLFRFGIKWKFIVFYIFQKYINKKNYLIKELLAIFFWFFTDKFGQVSHKGPQGDSIIGQYVTLEVGLVNIPILGSRFVGFLICGDPDSTWILGNHFLNQRIFSLKSPNNLTQDRRSVTIPISLHVSLIFQ